MNKYQHVIDVLTKKDEITTVSGPVSNWRVKVYPKPTIWLTPKLLTTKCVKNTINKVKYGKKEGK